MSEIKPTAEGIDLEVSRPGPFISEPTRQLRNENLLAHLTNGMIRRLYSASSWEQAERANGTTSHRHLLLLVGCAVSNSAAS